MKRIVLPLLITILAVVVIVSVGYRTIVRQGTSTGESASSSSSLETDLPPTPNVTYDGTVTAQEASGDTTTAPRYRLTLQGGSSIILEASDANLNLASYEGKSVEVRGSARPSEEEGVMLLRVEEVTVLEPASESAASESPAIVSSASASSPDTAPSLPTIASSVATSLPPAPSLPPAVISSSANHSSSQSSIPPPSVSSQQASLTSASSVSSTDAPSSDAIALMEKQKIDSSQWTQQYCTSHIAFCMPIHRNWYYKSFGATTMNLWHVEIGISPIEEIGDGIIVLNLVDGSSASLDASDGQILARGTDIIGFKDWNNGKQHFELIAPTGLKDTIAYLLAHITPYTPAP